MVTNVFFNNYGSIAEQKLIEDLIVESIRIFGHDCFYLPRASAEPDQVLNEDEYNIFSDAYQVELYIRNYDAFEGDGQLLGKFGLEIRDQMTLTMSIRTFKQDIAPFTALTRPREGDLIWIPMLKAAYKIKFVNNSPIFYQMGSLQCYDLITELFEYSNEPFATGVAEIDSTYNKYVSDSTFFGILAEDGHLITTENFDNIALESYNPDPTNIYADNKDIQEISDTILDFSEKDPFTEGTY